MEEIGVDFSVDPNEAKNTLFVTEPTNAWPQKNPDYSLPTYNLAAAPPLHSPPSWGEDVNLKKNFHQKIIKTETSTYDIRFKQFSFFKYVLVKKYVHESRKSRHHLHLIMLVLRLRWFS